MHGKNTLNDLPRKKREVRLKLEVPLALALLFALLARGFLVRVAVIDWLPVAVRLALALRLEPIRWGGQLGLGVGRSLLLLGSHKPLGLALDLHGRHLCRHEISHTLLCVRIRRHVPADHVRVMLYIGGRQPNSVKDIQVGLAAGLQERHPAARVLALAPLCLRSCPPCDDARPEPATEALRAG